MSKYLTYDQRLEIEAGLKNCLSFGAIGKIILKVSFLNHLMILVVDWG